MNRKLKTLIVFLVCILLVSCGKQKSEPESSSFDKTVVVAPHEIESQSVKYNTSSIDSSEKSVIEYEPASDDKDFQDEVSSSLAEQEDAQEIQKPVQQNGKLVVIDAGHQEHGNSEQEPIGPGASETKPKVSSGTSGCVSGMNEYELTLQVAKKLEQILDERGYRVIMVRTSSDVNISNSERAFVANDAMADAFIRIHANGSENADKTGAMTICQTPDNPYNGDLYSECKHLASCVLDELVAETGCDREYVWETDTMSGVNWSQVPVTIVEMGYMSNPEEDAAMADEKYQAQIASGIANGLDRYFTE